MNLNKNNNFVTSVLLFAITFLVVSTVIIITPSIRQQQQIQTARAITSSATATAATSSASTSSSSTTTTTNPTETFNLVFDGKIFPIKYQITGIGGNNKLNSITVKESINKDKTQKIATALTVNIVAVSNGKLIIALPTALIDSPITFSVFEDNKFTQQVKEITRFSNLVQQQQIHILSIDFNKGTKQIEIDNVSNTGLHFKVNNSTAAATTTTAKATTTTVIVKSNNDNNNNNNHEVNSKEDLCSNSPNNSNCNALNIGRISGWLRSR